jgi:hypothetical protein
MAVQQNPSGDPRLHCVGFVVANIQACAQEMARTRKTLLLEFPQETAAIA